MILITVVSLQNCKTIETREYQLGFKARERQKDTSRILGKQISKDNDINFFLMYFTLADSGPRHSSPKHPTAACMWGRSKLAVLNSSTVKNKAA